MSNYTDRYPPSKERYSRAPPHLYQEVIQYLKEKLEIAAIRRLTLGEDIHQKTLDTLKTLCIEAPVLAYAYLKLPSNYIHMLAQKTWQLSYIKNKKGESHCLG